MAQVIAVRYANLHSLQDLLTRLFPGQHTLAVSMAVPLRVLGETQGAAGKAFLGAIIFLADQSTAQTRRGKYVISGAPRDLTLVCFHVNF